MTITAEGRSRHRLVKAAAGLALVGSAAGLVATGVAQAAPAAPPINVTATTGTTATTVVINVDWDAAATGEPATFYRVFLDNVATAPAGPAPGADLTFVVPANQTNLLGVTATPNATYAIQVQAGNGETPPPATLVPQVTVTTPSVPPTPGSCATAEWTPFCTVDAFTTQQYRDWQDRAPRLDELNFAAAFLTPRNEVANGTQNVFMNDMRNTKDIIAGPVTRLYSAYFLRNPDFGGYEYWNNAVAFGGWSMNRVSDFFAASPEFVRTYGALDNAEFVSLVYNNVLGRNPDAGGFAFWTRQLDAGNSRGWMMLQFSEAPSQEFQRKTAVSVAVTEVYAAMLNRAPTPAEYASYVNSIPAAYPITAAAANVLYVNVLHSAEYASAARQGGAIVIRLPGT